MTKRVSFVLVALLLAGAGLYFRAQNASQAKKSVSQIIATDNTGVSTTTAITNLETYSHSHMGASVSFTLSGSFSRAQAAATASANAQSSASSALYAAAQRACMGHTDSITQANCNTAYIQSHLQSINMTTVPQPKLAAYRYSFKSPFWAPDLAGALFLGAAVALALSLIMERNPY